MLYCSCEENKAKMVSREQCKNCSCFGNQCDGVSAFDILPDFGYVLVHYPTGNGRLLDRVYLLRSNGIAVHRGKPEKLTDVIAVCKSVYFYKTLADVISRDYTICFKKAGEKRQTRFEVKRYYQNSLPTKGVVLETGEITTLSDFMNENGYEETDVVSVITKPENNKIRAFARMRYKG